MTNPQSPLDVVIEMLRDLEEFERSGGKEAFRKQLREEFVRRSGAASLAEALAPAITSLLCETLGMRRPSRKRVARSPKRRKPAGQERQSVVGEGLPSARLVRYLAMDQ